MCQAVTGECSPGVDASRSCFAGARCEPTAGGGGRCTFAPETPRLFAAERDLTVSGPGKFTVTDDDFMNPFECTYEGDSFSCPKRLAGSNKPEPTIDATLIYNVSISGNLDSETELSGTQTVDLSCEGTSCGLAAILGYMLPCAYSYSFTADAT